MKYKSANSFFKDKFGTKIIKIAIDANFTCPNRDGTLSYGGCIFCSDRGSGDHAFDRELSITQQIQNMKDKMHKKWPNGKYMAYFQAFTNTYAHVDILREKYYEAINQEDVAAISIATRPDCLNDENVALLSEISERIPLFVELGLQSSKESTIELINRCYENSAFEEGVRRLKEINANVIAHVILGLPFETK